MPVPVLLAAAGIALLVGAVAGLYPALRAARLVPAEALRLASDVRAYIISSVKGSRTVLSSV